MKYNIHQSLVLSPSTAYYRCTSYTGSVCRDVIGSGPVVVNLDSEAMFRTYKRMYTNSYLKVNVDAQCDAFLRAQYCGVSTVTCTDRVYCGAYDDDEIGQCGVNSCKCSGANIDQQTCNKVLRDLFTANGGGRNYYKTGQQPQGKNCTTFNIRE